MLLLYRSLLIVTLCCVSVAAYANDALETADNSAVRVLVYFNVGHDEAPAINVTTEQFEAHLNLLSQDEYNVVSLEEINTAYKSGAELPQNAVAITFDGSRKSVIDHAVPLLEQYKFPYTIFVSTDHLDSNDLRYINWKTLKKLNKSKFATIGLHSAEYADISSTNIETMRLNINKAKSRFREEMNFIPNYFAYPFGSYNDQYRQIINEQKFNLVFGQQSGVAYGEQSSKNVILPRFTMTESYADHDRLYMVINSLPFPAGDITPANSFLKEDSSVGFTFIDELIDVKDKTSCFVSNQEKPEKILLSDNRIELRLQSNKAHNRLRINCTLPVEDKDDEITRWRWLGMLFTN